MSLVKGSKRYRVKVVEYRLRNVVFATSFVLLLVLGSASVSYWYGHRIGMAGQEQALTDAARYKLASEDFKAQAERLDQQLTNIKMASEVDRHASEDVRQEVIALKEEIARLTEENNFYRGIMAPNEKSSGLTLGAVEIVGTREAGVYNFKVVVQQLATRHNLLSGSIRITIVGLEQGIEKRYPLSSFSEAVKGESTRLRFKYFQVIEGSLVIPENFNPEGIEIEAKTNGAKPQSISKKFGWLVEEI